MQYAHTLLFVCPDCKLPIAISKISDEKNLEQIDGARVCVTCNYCGHISEQLALTAKTHWVTDWADSMGSLSKETKAGQPNSESNLRER